MTDKDPPSKDEFKARLAKAQQKQEEASWESRDLKVERSGAYGRAWRLSVEIVAALALCGWFGWLLDRWLDTKPWLLLVFLIIGAGVGLYNVFKVAKQMNTGDLDE
ncbi:MAG: AtpZ/AtpI family protein [Proteobacteria bacterium]|nr:AtpZ/AtpI family protein [Pseudomonadota bacterium]